MYREVTMIEFREVLRLWQEQVPKKRIAAQLGLDPKTVRRYLRAAEAAELRAPMETLSDEQVRDVLLTLQPSGGRPHGEDWTRCGEQREAIQHWLVEGLRLTKIRKLLARQGVSIGYPTLYRFAVEQLQFGRAVFDVRRLQRMLEQAATSSATASPAPLPAARFLRPASQYALPLAWRQPSSKKGDDPQ